MFSNCSLHEMSALEEPISITLPLVEVMLTVTLWFALAPALLLHEIVNVVGAVNAGEASLPFVVVLPVCAQPPDLLHATALVEVQLNTVGEGGAGGLPPLGGRALPFDDALLAVEPPPQAASAAHSASTAHRFVNNENCIGNARMAFTIGAIAARQNPSYDNRHCVCDGRRRTWLSRQRVVFPGSERRRRDQHGIVQA
jgi:hypothetical protein